MSTAIAPKRPEIKTTLPGPKGRAIVEADAKFVNPSYPRPSFKLVAERAQGVWVEDVDGNIFLDCNAGVAVCSTGHCHPEVVRAIQDQAAELIHMCGTDYYYRQMPQLAQKLDEIVPVPSPTRTHFANSGTEAVETALETGDACYRPREVHRVLQQFSWPHAGLAFVDFIEGGAATRLQAPGARRGPRALSERVSQSVQRRRLLKAKARAAAL